MIARKATLQNLQDALSKVNEKYSNNVIWNREPDQYGKGYKFTLRVRSSRGKGARLGTLGLMGMGKPRHLISACWHVHGDFFDALFAINPLAYIWSGGRKITADFGNWQDRNIGSLMNPVDFSTACECDGVLSEVK